MKKSHQCILPDDPHQYFGNKKSAWNSQVNCPKSPFSSHYNKSRDWWNHFQWPWGNCTWYEEDARYRHRALGNKGEILLCPERNQVVWKLLRKFHFSILKAQVLWIKLSLISIYLNVSVLSKSIWILKRIYLHGSAPGLERLVSISI